MFREGTIFILRQGLVGFRNDYKSDVSLSDGNEGTTKIGICHLYLLLTNLSIIRIRNHYI
jgi:hypothetical protein